jgi:hypothetical protein
MKIVGISGKLGSGKGSVTKILKKINSKFIERFFAEKLKKFTADLVGVDYELTLTQEGKNTFIETFNMTLGEILQIIGTDALRNNFDKNVWAKSIFTTLKDDGYYILSDLRFENECEYIKKNKGILLRINRPVNPIGENSARNLEHSSETQLDNYEHFDYIIENNGTYEELIKKVEKFYDIYFKIIITTNTIESNKLYEELKKI